MLFPKRQKENSLPENIIFLLQGFDMIFISGTHFQSAKNNIQDVVIGLIKPGFTFFLQQQN